MMMMITNILLQVLITLRNYMKTEDTSSSHHKNKDCTSQIVWVDTPAELKVIEKEEVQLAVWQQSELAPFAHLLANDPSIQAPDLPTFAGLVTPETVGEIMMSRLSCHYPIRSRANRALDSVGLQALVTEVATLVRMFCEISQQIHADVKLDVMMDDDGCKFWHQDCVDYRLVKTYRGPCTEWVPPDRSHATLQRRKLDSKYAQSLSHTHVALFKGRGETAEDDDFWVNQGSFTDPLVPTGLERFVWFW